MTTLKFKKNVPAKTRKYVSSIVSNILGDINEPLPKRVYCVGRKFYGIPTGKVRPCQQVEGCRGRQIQVRWPDGKTTWPCGRGMKWSPKGQVAEIE